MKFSLCMIVKNEEKALPICLDSVKDIFDEIIIADTGSTDSTKNVAATYTDKIFDFKWTNDFSAARNFSFSKATGDFIMWLDADDVLEEKDRAALLELKEKISYETDVVMMKYAVSFDNNGTPDFFYYRERFVKRMANLKWSGFVHEVITPRGNIIYEDITVCHKPLPDKKKNPTRNLNIYREMLEKGVKLTARETYYYARELYYNDKKDTAAGYFEKFLEQPSGWYADKVGACIMLYHIYSEKDSDKAVDVLAKALSYDAVNPEVLCYMGDLQLKKGKLTQAIFWYNSALMCPDEYSKDGFVLTEYKDYYPLMQLCVCYDRMGEYEKAKECNRLAGLNKPDSEQVKYNEKYFENIKNEDNEAEKTE